MKFYKCDICGKIIDKDDARARKSERNTFSLGLYAGMFSDIDVCGDCMRVGDKVDFQSIALVAWREAVKNEA